MFKKFLMILVVVFVVQSDAYARVMMMPPTEQPQVENEQEHADMAAPVQALIAAPDEFVAPPEDPSAPTMKMVAPLAELAPPGFVGDLAPVSASKTGMSSSLLRALLIFSVSVLGLLLFFKFRKKKN